MKKLRILLLLVSILMISISPIYATEEEDINTATSSIEIIDGVIQREERITLDGYVIPDEFERNIESFDDDSLHLLECLSLCGTSSDFYLFVDNTKCCTIPNTYINMFAYNYTPFTFYLIEDNQQVGIIETNGVFVDDGNFPAHVNLAYGADFLQITFDSNATLTGSFNLSIPCVEYIGYSFDVYDNGTIINSSIVSDNGMLTLSIDNMNTKSIQFYPNNHINADMEYVLDNENETKTDIIEDSNTSNTGIIILISVISILVISAGITVLYIIKKNSKNKTNKKKNKKG